MTAALVFSDWPVYAAFFGGGVVFVLIVSFFRKS